MELIKKYFPELTEHQVQLFSELEPLYSSWNSKINVISRKDISMFYERHVLHSLAIAKIISFKPNTHILDVGTGGGFPGIPLAIAFPQANFYLVDSIGKKIKVVNSIIQNLGLKNARAKQTRAEQVNTKYDFVVSRAVTAFPKFVPLISSKISKKQANSIPNGVLYLKGGDITDEIKPYKKKAFMYDLNEIFDEEFFETKKLIHLPIV